MASQAAFRSLLHSGKVRRGMPARTAAPGSLDGESLDRAGFDRAGLCGRFVELVCAGAGAGLTVATGLVLETQRRFEPVAWIAHPEAPFFAPDLAAAGIDLDALAVVWVEAVPAALRAADHLLRSGAFALVVIDLSHAGRVALPMAAQVRLAGLAKQHEAVLLLLLGAAGSGRGGGSAGGSLASLRATPSRQRLPDRRFQVRLEVTKDKRHGEPGQCVEVLHGPVGLR